MSKLYSVSIFNSIIIIIIVYVSNVPYYYSSHIGLNNIEDNILIFTKCTNTYVFIMHRYLRKFLQFQNKVHIIYTIHSIPMSLIPCDKSLPLTNLFENGVVIFLTNIFILVFRICNQFPCSI